MPLSSVLGAQSITKPGVCTSTTRPASPYDGQVIYETDTDRVASYNGSAWVYTATGTVLQVKSTIKTDTFSSTSTTYTDITGLSVSITPNSTSNKVLVMLTINVSQTQDRATFIQLVRNSTAIAIGDAAGNRQRASGFATSSYTDSSTENFSENMGIMFLDSPATTSSTTYKAQGLVNTTGTFCVNRMLNDTDASTRPRTVSTITVFEVIA